MAAKGSVAKGEIMNKILEAFDGSFLYNSGKEIRINWVEDGVPVQIKVTLTAAKSAVTPDGESTPTPAPSKAKTTESFIDFESKVSPIIKPDNVDSVDNVEPSQQEKEGVRAMLQELGLM